MSAILPSPRLPTAEVPDVLLTEVGALSSVSGSLVFVEKADEVTLECRFSNVLIEACLYWSDIVQGWYPASM
jgi:hypothetical protein